MRGFVVLHVGEKKVVIRRMKVQCYKCKNEECDYDWLENIPFVTSSHSYTHRFTKHVVELLREMTLQDVPWDTVKEIPSMYLERYYIPPSLKGI